MGRGWTRAVLALGACLPALGLQKNAMLRLPCEKTQLLSAKLCFSTISSTSPQPASLGHYK